ncbi:MAG: hypothetical protein HN737_03350 [Desulfobacterales bacterium]|nr:hypothetical protein [Desulfobacteraceae bacterium]MBT7696428.1 hypothetical protein [Desulfobacterales bacterium]
MTLQSWPTDKWPQGVPCEVSGFEKPLFSILDDSVQDFPNQVYTIFSDNTRTFDEK